MPSVNLSGAAIVGNDTFDQASARIGVGGKCVFPPSPPGPGRRYGCKRQRRARIDHPFLYERSLGSLPLFLIEIWQTRLRDHEGCIPGGVLKALRLGLLTRRTE